MKLISRLLLTIGLLSITTNSAFPATTIALHGTIDYSTSTLYLLGQPMDLKITLASDAPASGYEASPGWWMNNFQVSSATLTINGTAYPLPFYQWLSTSAILSPTGNEFGLTAQSASTGLTNPTQFQFSLFSESSLAVDSNYLPLPGLPMSTFYTPLIRAFDNTFGVDGNYWTGMAEATVTSYSITSDSDAVAPVLTLPANQTLEATSPSGAVATFTASATDIVDGSVPVALSALSGSTFPIGTTTVTANATDAAGNTATGSFTITVRDTTAPVFTSLTASPNVLRPVNHKMVAVKLSAKVADAADPAPVTKILSISSNQPADGCGDGNTSIDWQITGQLMLNLRAERAGCAGDRIYTITVESRDRSNNASTRTVTVTVPHNG